MSVSTSPGVARVAGPCLWSSRPCCDRRGRAAAGRLRQRTTIRRAPRARARRRYTRCCHRRPSLKPAPAGMTSIRSPATSRTRRGRATSAPRASSRPASTTSSRRPSASDRHQVAFDETPFTASSCRSRAATEPGGDVRHVRQRRPREGAELRRLRQDRRHHRAKGNPKGITNLNSLAGKTVDRRERHHPAGPAAPPEQDIRQLRPEAR